MSNNALVIALVIVVALGFYMSSTPDTSTIPTGTQGSGSTSTKSKAERIESLTKHAEATPIAPPEPGKITIIDDSKIPTGEVVGCSGASCGVSPEPTQRAPPVREEEIAFDKEEEKVNLKDGSYCGFSEQCASGNCQNGVCCPKGKTCCLITHQCEFGQECKDETSACEKAFEFDSDTMSKINLCLKEHDKNYCYTEYGILQKNSVICGYITDVRDQRECYIGVALETGDYKPCLNILDKNYRDNKCLYLLAKRTLDDTICEHITSEYEHDECYIVMAQKFADPSYCVEIVDDYALDQCYLTVANVTGYAKESLCEEIKDAGKRGFCYVHLIDAVVERNDEPSCDRISDEKYKELCKAYFVSDSNDASFCDGMSTTDLNAICNTNLAVNAKDEQYCDKISDNNPPFYYRQNCFFDVARSTGKEEGCALLSGDEKISCEAQAAGDAEKCKTIESESKQSRCIQAIAFDTNNEDLCGDILVEKYKLDCFKQIKWTDVYENLKFRSGGMIGR